MPHVEPMARGIESPVDLREELAELCRVHDVALEMIERSDDFGHLMDTILEEYDRRLADLSAEALHAVTDDLPGAQAAKLRALIVFAGQAAALKEKAVAAAELQARAAALELAHDRLSAALADSEAAHRRLESVLAALDAGIMILSSDGTIQAANRAASAIAGRRDGDLRGEPARDLLGNVAPGTDGEVRVVGENGDGRVLMVARRHLDADGAEVVLLSDITRHSRELEERHRLEKLAGVLQTLSVLAHKINNPLTALLGRAQMLKMNGSHDPRVLKSASIVEESALRIAELIRELAKVVKEGKQEAVDRVLSLDVRGQDGVVGS